MTTVHILDSTGTRCSLCGTPLPPSDGAPGEYVGFITGYPSSPDVAYRIGGNNRDLLCDGSDSTTFGQESRKPSEKS